LCPPKKTRFKWFFETPTPLFSNFVLITNRKNDEHRKTRSFAAQKKIVCASSERKQVTIILQFFYNHLSQPINNIFNTIVRFHFSVHQFFFPFTQIKRLTSLCFSKFCMAGNIDKVFAFKPIRNTNHNCYEKNNLQTNQECYWIFQFTCWLCQYIKCLLPVRKLELLIIIICESDLNRPQKPNEFEMKENFVDYTDHDYVNVEALDK
jgi:hypothetical protein